MKQLLHGLHLLAFLCLLGSAACRRGAGRINQIKSPSMSKALSPKEYRYAIWSLNGIDALEPFMTASNAFQCFGVAAQVIIDGGTPICKMTGPHKMALHIPTSEDPSIAPKEYQRGEKKINELAYKFRFFPKAMKPLTDEDPAVPMALVGLSPHRKWEIAKKFGRLLLEEDDAMKNQNFFSDPSRPKVPSGSASRKAAKDTKNIKKWWNKARPKSTRKGRTEDRRSESDDKEEVDRVVSYIVRQAFGDFLDFLDDDTSFGLDPDQDDVPKKLLSRTSEEKKYPAIFKGDAAVLVREVNFYEARKILHPSKDDD